MLNLSVTRRLAIVIAILAASPPAGAGGEPEWNQWRGPGRNGIVQGLTWPSSLSDGVLTRLWRVELPPSYSGPIVSDSAVFVTGTIDRQQEAVISLNRETGEELWRADWPGAIQVPLFAASNGSWIRSTPALNGNNLFVAGMRDVLVSLNARTGEVQWRVDFAAEFRSPLPTFGCVSSPLVDGDAVYHQAGASLVRLDKATGQVAWRAVKDDGGMKGGAFSSPVMATLAGKRQLVVQTREKLVGVDPESGDVLWEQNVPSFRGMNILTPVVAGDSVFTSSYQNKSWLFNVSKSADTFTVAKRWNNNAQAYMSTPVVIDGHAYLHLQNQRFTCFNLNSGQRTWTSKPYGKYSSLVAQDDLILALDERGELLLLRANPQEFELLDQRKVSEQETWAHLAVCGDELFVRNLNGLSVFRWQNVKPE